MKTLSRILFVFLLASPLVYAEDTPPKDKPAEPGTSGETEKPPAPPATTGETEKPAKPTKLTSDELQLLAHYHELDLLHVELGKAAQKRGGTQAVKAFGAMMAKEHGESDKENLAFAKKHGQKLPEEQPASEAEKQEKAADKTKAAGIKKLGGADFDRQYLQLVVDSHDKELAKIDAMAGKAQSAELAELVKGKKTVLQRHADAARELQKSEAQASR